MASGTISKERIKNDDLLLGSQSINSGGTATYNLPSTYDDKKVVAIIPISVGPTSWGTTVPGVFSGVNVSTKAVTIRAYTTSSFNPRVHVLYY